MTATTPEPDRDRAELENGLRRRHLWATLSLTLFSTMLYLTTVLFASGRLPNAMATHFDIAGRADGFMRTTTALLFQGAIVVLLPLMLFLAFWRAGWWRGEYARSLSATVCGLSMAVATMFVVLTRAHVDVADPAMVQLTLPMGMLILASGVVAAVAVVSLLPAPLPRPEPAPVVPLRVAPSYRVSWFGKARMGQTFVLVMMCAVAMLVAGALASGIWWMWLIVALLILMVATLSSFDVIVDSRGVRWRGSLGLPRGGARLRDVSAVSVIDVEPGDFGGYGVRVLPGRVGIITRSGRALRVVYGAKQLVITVDDAETAAGVLEGLRLKGRGPAR